MIQEVKRSFIRHLDYQKKYLNSERINLIIADKKLTVYMNILLKHNKNQYNKYLDCLYKSSDSNIKNFALSNCIVNNFYRAFSLATAGNFTLNNVSINNISKITRF